MQCVHDSNFAAPRETAVTLGKFDGVHLGHRKLIETVMQQQGLCPALLTFHPHPVFLFAKDDVELLTTPQEKKEMIASLGIALMLEYPFTYEFSQQEPERFAREIIFGNLKCRFLAIGEDFRFGKEKKGDYRLLQAIGAEYGARVVEIPTLTYENEKVSSSLIRAKIKLGTDINKAGQMLGGCYSITGTVVTGKQIGRTIGFPTLNIDVPEIKVRPGNGVYITQTIIGGKQKYNSITNIGTNPTVSGAKKTIETHVFDFTEEIYGAEITVLIHHFLRREKKFSGLVALKEQLVQDKIAAVQYGVFNQSSFEERLP